MMFEQLVSGITDPVILFGHFTYLLLIVSMLMRRMVWLRALAVASGLAKIVYRGFMVFDPVSVLWETIFVLVNVGQLLVIWYFERHHRFHDDEQHFAENMPTGIERRSIRRLLSHATRRTVEVGATITIEGQPVTDLTYIAVGLVQIERDGKIIAVCGPGDFLGEMSFLTGATASATARAIKPVRCLAFNQAKLRRGAEVDANVRKALEARLNHNLVGKLIRTNGGGAELVTATS
jgi:hypothetical protein